MQFKCKWDQSLNLCSSIIFKLYFWTFEYYWLRKGYLLYEFISYRLVICNRTVNSACIRCDNNRKVTSSIGEPLNRRRSPARTARKSGMSDNFWNGSTFDKDKSASQSGGSYSTVSTSNQTLEVSGSGNGDNPSEFVNHGKLFILLRYLLITPMLAVSLFFG